MSLLLWLAVAWAEPGAKDPLESARYTFCHQPGIEAQQAREWCEALRDEPPERCPGLRAVCAGEEPEPSGCAMEPGAGGGAGWQKAPKEESEPWALPACALPDVPSHLGWLRWPAAVVIAAGVGLVVRGILRSRRRSGVAHTRPAPAAEGNAVETATESDWRLLAERALAEGRFAEALELGHAAARRRVSHAHGTSVTDRELLRMLDPSSAEAAAWREIVHAAEAPVWGAQPTEAERARRVVAAAGRLLTAWWIVAVVAGASAEASGDQAYGNSGWYSIFRAAGYEVSTRVADFDDRAPDADVLVLRGEDLPNEATARSELREWVESGGVVVASGPVEGLFPELGTRMQTLGDPRPTNAFPGDLPIPRWPEGILEAWRLPAESEGVVWVADVATDGLDAALVVVLPIASGGVLAVADERFFVNASLIASDNAAFGAAALTAGEDVGAFFVPPTARVEFATRVETSSTSPVDTIEASGLFPLVAQGVLLTALVLWWRGWRFGPARRETMGERAEFADHVRALGARYGAVGATRYAYASYAKDALRRRGPSGLEAAAIRAGRSPERARALVRRWEDVAASPEAPNAPTDTTELEELCSIDRTLSNRKR